MLVSDQGELCFSCHEELQDNLADARSKHAPVMTGECTKCHNPHKAALTGLMLAQSPDICTSCHQQLKKKMDDERVHSPAARDCLRCHKPHFSSEESIMTLPLEKLCGDCHDAEKDSFKKSHLGIAAAVMDCNNCHNPHASKDAKFFKQKLHAPFASRSCEPCHVVEKQ
jgi:predicted CXXCH cytochrome family protein